MRALSIVAAWLALAVPAAAQTVTKAQIRSQPPEQTARDLQGQLWGAFVPEDLRSRDPRQPPQAVLEDVSMRTRPYPVHATGLCRRDTMVMDFRPDPPVRGARADAQTPVRAYAIDVLHSYYAAEPLTGDWWMGEPEWEERRGWKICSAQTGAHFIRAESDVIAGGGLYAMQLAIEAVAKGQQAPTCRMHYESAAACQTAYAETIASGPLSVNECDRSIGYSYTGTCFWVQFSSNALVFRRPPDASAGTVPSVEVLSVTILDHSGLAPD